MRDESLMNIFLINIRSLNDEKMMELIKAVERNSRLNDLNIVCMTETHERFDKVELSLIHI